MGNGRCRFGGIGLRKRFTRLPLRDADHQRPGLWCGLAQIKRRRKHSDPPVDRLGSKRFVVGQTDRNTKKLTRTSTRVDVLLCPMAFVFTVALAEGAAQRATQHPAESMDFETAALVGPALGALGGGGGNTIRGSVDYMYVDIGGRSSFAPGDETADTLRLGIAAAIRVLGGTSLSISHATVNGNVQLFEGAGLVATFSRLISLKGGGSITSLIRPTCGSRESVFALGTALLTATSSGLLLFGALTKGAFPRGRAREKLS